MSLLGFGALGKYALAELPQPAQSALSLPFGQFAGPIKRAGLSAAVLATTVGGFLAPPPAAAATQFSSFQQPIKARTPQQQAWLNTPFVPGQTIAGFTTFGQPQASSRGSSAARIPSWGFAPPPVSVPYVGFFDFAAPRATRVNIAAKLASVAFEVNPLLPLPGGGTSRKLIEDSPRKAHRKTGLEPIKKQWAKPKLEEPAGLPLPPFRDLRAPGWDKLQPPELVDHKPEPGSFLELQAQIHAAEDASDVEKFLGQLEQDEHDAADIADLIALLEAEDD